MRGMVRMRLEPQDDYLHAVEAATNFNESRYYNWFDAGIGMGGWVRMGSRPNEGYAEMTVCCYLPDGASRSTTSGRRSTVTRRTMPAACASTCSRPTRSITSHTPARCAYSLASARWPIRRVRSTTTHTRSAPSISRSRLSADRGAASPNGKRARSSPTSIPRRCSLAVTPSSTCRSRERSRSAKSGSTSPTRSACATTRGARVSGRTSGGTAGSP